MLTAWGYEIDGTQLPPLLTVEAFDDMTGGRYAGDLRAASALGAASQAVRNACGWHISPQLECTATPLLVQPRLVALPANAVTAVESVTENGVELAEGEYEWRRDGLVRRACFERWPSNWDALTIAYTAGYDAGAVPDLAEAVRAIAEGVIAIAGSAGVRSESADGVTVSYSSDASSVAAALTEQQRSALVPYRLVMAHAT
ncbi:MAG: hypothetical protein IKE55_03240 [Kiritimatiellae bacterium]|nr:hypothetical protein [Kiritimatiellia bacterium]